MAVVWELDVAGATVVDGRTELIPVTATANLADVPATAIGPSVVVAGAHTVLNLNGSGTLGTDAAVPALPSVGYMTVVYGARVLTYDWSMIAVYGDTSTWDLSIAGDAVNGAFVRAAFGGHVVVGAAPDDGQWHVAVVAWDEATGMTVYLDGISVGTAAGALTPMTDTAFHLVNETHSAGDPVFSGTRLAAVHVADGTLVNPAAHAGALLFTYGAIPLQIDGLVVWTEPNDGGMPITRYVVDIALDGATPSIVRTQVVPDEVTGIVPTEFDIFAFLGGPASGSVQITAVNARGASSPSIGVAF